MKRDDDTAEGVEPPPVERRKRYKRHALNDTGSSWVDSFQLPDELRLTRAQFDELWALHPAQYGQVKLYGKTLDTPRWQQAYGQPYRFSGMDHAALPMPAQVQPLLDYANSLSQYTSKEHGGGPFNMALLNWYEDGAHHIGYHRDDESTMRKTPQGETLVFSLSFGAQRPLSLRPYNNGPGKALKLEQPNNSALVMGGLCQRTHQHAILKVSGKKAQQMGKRINVTFRQFVERETPK